MGRVELNGLPVQKGQPLSFSVAQGRNGPIAVELQLSDCGQSNNTPSLDGRRCLGGIGQNFQGTFGVHSDRPLERFVGCIKSYNPDKGWGFIACAMTHEIYGKDIIVL